MAGKPQLSSLTFVGFYVNAAIDQAKGVPRNRGRGPPGFNKSLEQS